MSGVCIRAIPCRACPYRRDVASGVWAEEEYEKLRAYDAPTASQPPAAFACHATPEHLCHGWALVHSNRGLEHELLALRLCGTPTLPDPVIALFASGAEAADHGQRDAMAPSATARTTIERLIRKHPRLLDAARAEPGG